MFWLLLQYRAGLGRKNKIQMILSLFAPKHLTKQKDLAFFLFFFFRNIFLSSRSFSFYTIISFTEYFSVYLNFLQSCAFMGSGFTSADTFRSFHILFWIPEIFSGTFDGLHYNSVLSQNIYQPTTLRCKISRVLIEPFLHKLGFKCTRKLSPSFQLQKICCHFTWNKTFHIDGHLLAPGKAKSV